MLLFISNEMKDLAGPARSRKLKPEECQGSTSAVSNLDMFGIKDFSAVINPPHATTLAVGAGEELAVVKNVEVKIAIVLCYGDSLILRLRCSHRRRWPQWSESADRNCARLLLTVLGTHSLLYAVLAEEVGCSFFDAGSVAEDTPLYSVHLDAENMRAIGHAIASTMRVVWSSRA